MFAHRLLGDVLSAGREWGWGPLTAPQGPHGPSNLGSTHAFSADKCASCYQVSYGYGVGSAPVRRQQSHPPRGWAPSAPAWAESSSWEVVQCIFTKSRLPPSGERGRRRVAHVGPMPACERPQRRSAPLEAALLHLIPALSSEFVSEPQGSDQETRGGWRGPTLGRHSSRSQQSAPHPLPQGVMTTAPGAGRPPGLLSCVEIQPINKRAAVRQPCS